MDWIVNPCKQVCGTLRVPGDKSISHRTALVAALADGESTLRGYLASADCLDMLKALERLGARVERRGTTVRVTGMGGAAQAPDAPLDCGNSGTAMRLLAGMVAGLPVRCELTGDASLLRRPMGRIVEPLASMGARIECLGEGGRAPLRIQGGGLQGLDYRMPVASAQVKSCLLLAGMSARGVTRITEPAPTRDHTERIFAALGLPLRVTGQTIEIEGADGKPPPIRPADWSVPGDFSSAAFWLTAAACRPGGRVTVRQVGVNPRRTALLDVLRRMGADVRLGPVRGADWEPRSDVTVVGGPGRLQGVCVRGDEIPNLIDEIPILCVAAALAGGETRILDAAELRVKESDRIASMLQLLETFGVPCDDLGDGMAVRGVPQPRGGGVIDSQGDHRIAMAAAMLALAADRPTRIRHVDCVATSYPGFRRHLRQLTTNPGNP